MTHIDVVPIETANLGDRSYVVGIGSGAVVVDPQRDIDRVMDVLDERSWQVSHVIETHVHNDYVSGGLELARQLGADYVVPSGMPISFAARQVDGTAELNLDGATIRALHTPGHTPNHLSYSVAVDGADRALFTGGSLLFGSVGRPDLLGPELTEPLARAQWASMRRIAAEISPDAQVYPTHGFGSFCSASSTVGTASTLAEQLRDNPVFTADEDAYVADLIAGLDVYPAYYAHMAPANQRGGGPIDLSLPRLATAADISQRIARGEWVVDLRERRLFAGEHVRGSLSFDVSGNAVTYLGWLIDWGTPITLLGATSDQVATMQRELVRIGIDRPAAYAVGGPNDWAADASEISTYPRRTHRDMATALAQDSTLPMIDLRRDSEYAEGFVRGAKHVPLHELRGREDEVRSWAAEQRQPVWLYCGSGFRASIAASMLDAQHIDVVHVDDDFSNAAPSGLPLESPRTVARIGSAYAD